LDLAHDNRLKLTPRILEVQVCLMVLVKIELIRVGQLTR
jgi:hypothetical protein